MNKKVVITVVAVLVLGGAVSILFMKNPAKAPSGSSSSSSADTMANMDHSSSNQSSQSTSPVSTDKVDIKDFAFSPASITVKKGTTVTWTNQDSTRHNIAPDKETADFKSSELLAQGATYSVTFNTTGTFTYHCTPHPYMKASVTVTE